jgi:hypothetical protein
MLSILEALSPNSVVGVLGRRSLNRVKTPDIGNERIKRQEDISKRLTPSPKNTEAEEDKLGFKKVKTLKQPHILV